MDDKTQQTISALENALLQSVKQCTFTLEKQFDDIIKNMIKAKMIEASERENIIIGLTNELYDTVMSEWASVLTPQDEINITSAIQTGLNEHQQRALLRQIYEDRRGKTIEEYLSEQYEELLKGFIRSYYTTMSSYEDLSLLSDDEIEHVDKLIDKDQWQEALDVIKKKKDKLGITDGIAVEDSADKRSSQKGGAKPKNFAEKTEKEKTKIVEETINLLKKGKYNEAKSLIRKL